MKDLNQRIRFIEHQESSDIFLPNEPYKLNSQKIVWREDPLTGRLSVMGEGLADKAAMFFGETDQELLEELVSNSKKNCIFCAGTVEKVTPKYPEDFISDGHMFGEQTILFPNLFPLSRIHAVVTWPHHHFLHPQDFSPEILTDAFVLTGKFAAEVKRFSPDVQSLSVNANHLFPAGASLIHPHIQILGSRVMPTEVARIHRCSQLYYEQYQQCYWTDLGVIEKELNQRWIAQTDSWNWFSGFSPIGSNEIIGVHSSEASLFGLKESDWGSLGNDLSRILRYYGDQDYSSFNYSLTGGRPGDEAFQRCIIRVISRQNFRENYRTDDYYLQKLLGAELIVIPPEALAGRLRQRFI